MSEGELLNMKVEVLKQQKLRVLRKVLQSSQMMYSVFIYCILELITQRSHKDGIRRPGQNQFLDIRICLLFHR